MSMNTSALNIGNITFGSSATNGASACTLSGNGNLVITNAGTIEMFTETLGTTNGGDILDVTVVAVPEPSTCAGLLLGGGLLLLAMVRRNQARVLNCPLGQDFEYGGFLWPQHFSCALPTAGCWKAVLVPQKLRSAG